MACSRETSSRIVHTSYHLCPVSITCMDFLAQAYFKLVTRTFPWSSPTERRLRLWQWIHYVRQLVYSELEYVRRSHYTGHSGDDTNPLRNDELPYPLALLFREFDVFTISDSLTDVVPVPLESPEEVSQLTRLVDADSCHFVEESLRYAICWRDGFAWITTTNGPCSNPWWLCSLSPPTSHHFTEVRNNVIGRTSFLPGFTAHNTAMLYATFAAYRCHPSVLPICTFQFSDADDVTITSRRIAFLSDNN